MSERRVLVIGGTGTIGSAVVRELSTDHHVEVAGRSSDPAVDLSDSTSIDRLADRLADGPIHEAVVVCAGGGMPGMVEDLDPSAALEALRPKLFGQIAVARAAPRFVRPGGAVVLTSGILERRPMPGMSHLSMINAALRAFALSAGTEQRTVRTCVVSPGLVRESPQAVLDFFSGMDTVAAADLAKVYRRLIESGRDGETIGLPEA
ncbi:MAG: short chain dehydrogenase [Phycisphaerae bacterium]|nr:short chain dehydrogenase [Phycisphaerae bacterium]